MESEADHVVDIEHVLKHCMRMLRDVVTEYFGSLEFEEILEVDLHKVLLSCDREYLDGLEEDFDGLAARVDALRSEIRRARIVKGLY